MRLARVERVVAAGRRIADPEDPLGREARDELCRTSGLSREGVDLALTRHLEIDPAPSDLDALLTRAGTAPRCHVVLSAHVCVGALRAIAIAVATSPEVFVRPSRRDPTLARRLAEALAKDTSFAGAGGAVRLVEAMDTASGDELHLYGSDEAMAALTAGAAPGVVVRAHGAGFGVAVIDAREDLSVAARALAADIVPFDQRGCLSPRFAFVEGGATRSEALARALHDALDSLGRVVPRGPLDDGTRAEVARYLESMRAAGEVLMGDAHAIGLDLTPRALLLPPAARVLHVVPLEAANLLVPWARFVTVVAGGAPPELLALAPRSRRVALGSMQRPPLDGPVDLR